MYKVKAKPAYYINTDIAFLDKTVDDQLRQRACLGLEIPDDLKEQIEDANKKMPYVLISFGADDEVVDQKALTIRETRQVIVDLVTALANLGDQLAKTIGDKYFSGNDEL